MKVEVTLEIKEDQIRDLLVTALEGGANYWYRVAGFENKKPSQINPTFYPPYVMTALSQDGAIMIMDDWEEPGMLKEPFRLNREAIIKGLKVMSEKQPHHFADFLGDNTDADTGDVFLQMCVFGEVIYG